MATGKFVIHTTTTGKFRFNLLAANHQIIATSETYSSKDGCENGIKSVKKNAPDAKIEDQTLANVETQSNPKFEIYTDKAGEFRFRLKARNGEIIAVGEGYKSKSSCINGIESIIKNAPDAPVEVAEKK